MLRVDANQISLTRGDTAYLIVPIFNDVTSEDYVLSPDDTITFTVKKTVDDTEFIFQKVMKGSNEIHILPEDTIGCSYTTYMYDVQLTTANGDVFTVIEPTKFRITSEVTF